uniref:E3 ubiquitin-protein ligase NRDP1-like isoform X2 n=1 Tax=Phascolarctos cinereus TaxID=38626 RepID=A0A6P5IT47_PHACI|nr:E3 ubiquitin-protein ligase NRDP1-like isoform X2 [Phascolarctos cinereus]
MDVGTLRQLPETDSARVFWLLDGSVSAEAAFSSGGRVWAQVGEERGYMRNDLNRLQLHCRNGERGCEMVCSLESVEQHERECEYGWISCTNTGCPVQVERRNLSGHLAACELRSQECPKGCGYTVFNSEDMQHNCIAELRSELVMLRVEMVYRMEKAAREMSSRLDSHRQHMVQKESLLQNEVVELKRQVFQMMSSVQSLIGAERLLHQELEQEKQELMELKKSLQDCRSTTADGNEKLTSLHSLTRLESVEKKTQGGDSHLKKVLHSSST